MLKIKLTRRGECCLQAGSLHCCVQGGQLQRKLSWSMVDDGDDGKFRQIVQCIGQVTMLLTAREHGVTAETCCAEELRWKTSLSFERSGTIIQEEWMTIWKWISAYSLFKFGMRKVSDKLRKFWDSWWWLMMAINGDDDYWSWFLVMMIIRDDW